MWPYFERSRRLLGEEAMEKLANAHIAVVGLGGVGGFAAEGIVRAGVGTVTLLDCDIVEPSNLNRQAAALHTTIGMPKTEVLAARAADINPGASIRILTTRYEESTRALFFSESYDGILDAIDSVSCKLDLIEQALKRDIPIVSALGTGNKTNPYLLRAGDLSKTEGCPLARVVRRELRKRGVRHHRVIWSPEVRRMPEKEEHPASIPWVPACAGFMLAGEMVMRLTGGAWAESPPK